MKEIKSTLTKIQEVFEGKAVEAHIFGSFARGDADLYSDLDIWFTFKDEDIKGVIAKRLDYYLQIAEIIHIHEAPQNAPIGGIQSFVLYKIGDELLRVDYSLCPQSSSFQTKDSKKLFGTELPVDDLSFNPQKVVVDTDYRIDFVISFVFNSMKYLARKKSNPLQDLLREYDNLKERYGIDIEPLLSRKESVETLRQIIQNLSEISNDRQREALSEISKFITKKFLSLKTQMTRNRSAGIVIKDNKVLIMHRINKGDEYWVFPGGGQEEGETPDQTAVREIDEETTIKVKVGRLVYHITWDTGEENFFYLCEYVSGEPRLRSDSEEIEQMKSGDQVYEPMWIEIDKLSELKLYQLEVRDLFLKDYKNGFPDNVQELFIKLAERRHK